MSQTRIFILSPYSIIFTSKRQRVCNFFLNFRMSIFMLHGKLWGSVNTTPAVFFALWSQLSEVFPACWTCEQRSEDKRRERKREIDNMMCQRVRVKEAEVLKETAEFDEVRHTLYVFCCRFSPELWILNSCPAFSLLLWELSLRHITV